MLTEQRGLIFAKRDDLENTRCKRRQTESQG